MGGPVREVPGQGPGQLLGEGRRGGREGQQLREEVLAPGGFAEDPGHQEQPRTEGDGFRVQEAGVGILGQLRLEVRQEGLALGLAPAGPEPGQGGPLHGLEHPGVPVVEAQVGLDGVQGRGVQEPGEEGVPDLVQVPVGGARVPDLGQEAGAVLVPADQVPGAPLSLAQVRGPGVAVGPQEARHFHGPLP